MCDLSLMAFLEDSLKDAIENNPKKVIVAYLDKDDAVVFSYNQCNYRDLQHIGQELINEGTLRLISESEDRIEEFKNEPEQEQNDGPL